MHTVKNSYQPNQYMEASSTAPLELLISPDDKLLNTAREFLDSECQTPELGSDYHIWQANRDRLRYLAQAKINELGSNAKNIYKLYKAMRMDVYWPGYFERRSLRRELQIATKKRRKDFIARTKIERLFEEIRLSKRRFEAKKSTYYRDKINDLVTEFNALLILNKESLCLDLQRETYVSI